MTLWSPVELGVSREADDRRVVSEARRLYRDIPAIHGAKVLDLGAHIGEATKSFVAQGAAWVTSVEAYPGSFRLLRESVAGLPVTPINAAVGPSEGTATLYYNERSPSCNRTTRPRRGGSEVVVPMRPLPALLEESRASVIKMDIEGAEYSLLDDLYALPEAVRVLVAEVHFDHQRTRAEGEALINSWHLQGFRLYRGQRWTARMYNFNGVWVR
jgi:FkbM family methyltransferase